MPPICRNCQNAYIFSLSKGLARYTPRTGTLFSFHGRRKRAPTEVSPGRDMRLRVRLLSLHLKNRASIEDSVAVISRKLSVSLRSQYAAIEFSYVILAGNRQQPVGWRMLTSGCPPE
jgi:hypothetical protein